MYCFHMLPHCYHKYGHHHFQQEGNGRSGLIGDRCYWYGIWKCIYASVFRILFVIPYSSLCRVSTWLWFVVLVVVMLLCVNFRQSYTLCVNWAQKTSCINGDIKKKSRRRVIHFVYIKNLRWSSYNVRIKTKHY